MTELNRAGEAGSLGDLDTIQRDFRDQIDVVADELRQLAGNADVPTDPLSAPYVLYVNAYTGSDAYVSGDYTSTGDLERRISLQKLECGYTEARPFRTINRAVIEAGIITSRDWFTNDVERDRALVSIIVAPGEQTVLNGPGNNNAIAEWTDGTVPTDDELTAFNPVEGGIILPRGCSLVSMDLRKTVIRPAFVPAAADEADDYSNRSAIFRMTGKGYYYGFTFRDQLNSNASHHLLSAFEFATEGQLVDFYRKIEQISSDVNGANADPRDFENQIVGPQPPNATRPTDTVDGASPYIYNVSIRSALGLCGVFANGDATTGFNSVVIAQFTGVSLQTDLSCWEVYNAGTWIPVNTYENLIQGDPDNIRMNPNRWSFHIRVANDAIIQEVSVFAIGQGIHHWAESGGELTITNSNSNFGGCSALAQGFKDVAAPKDTQWNTAFVRRAINPFELTGNIKRITLGRLVAGQANQVTTLTLEDPFNPALLERDDYSLRAGDFVWVDNPGGADYRAQLADPPWNEAVPNLIQIQDIVRTDNADGNVNPGDGVDNNTYQNIEGNRVYIRRLLDVRSVDERRYSIILQGVADANQRIPVKEYVVQPEIGAWNERIVSVNAAETTTDVPNGVNVEVKVAFRPEDETNFQTTRFYRSGDTVRRNNKHFTAGQNAFGAFDESQWSESYVHMQEDYSAPDFYKNAQPLIVFNGDTDESEASQTMGFALDDAIVEAQYESGTDYQGAFNYLRNLGRSIAQAEALLIPVPDDQRNAAIAGAVEFRRPSIVRTFGMAYEWAGYLNYTKALPQYQGDLSRVNKFTYYFSNERGGKVFASGFNEEGFIVSNRGLEEVETGKVIGFENISNSDIEIDIPDLPIASQAQQGIVELATQAETVAGERDDLAVTPAGISALAQANASPVGSVVAFAGAAPPDGWLHCNGTAIPNIYPQLIALVGANVPDLRGEFIRGWDNGRGVDVNRGLMTAQADEFREHNHTVGISNRPIADGGVNGAHMEGIHGTSAVGGRETRPRNFSLMYIIRHD